VASSEQRHTTGLVPQTQMTSHVPSTSREEPPGIVGPEEEDYESLPTTSLRIQLLAGAIAGIAEHTIVYPIDAIKVGPLLTAVCPGDKLMVDSYAGG
jgi:hypothetical protein